MQFLMGFFVVGLRVFFPLRECLTGWEALDFVLELVIVSIENKVVEGQNGSLVRY